MACKVRIVFQNVADGFNILIVACGCKRCALCHDKNKEISFGDLCTQVHVNEGDQFNLIINCNSPG